MKDLHQKFIDSYLSIFPPLAVYSDDIPQDMRASAITSDGWINWKPVKGTLEEKEYDDLEKQFGVLYPKSFIEWHKSFFFLNVDCSILRLPGSNPNEPLKHLKQQLDWFIPEQLIPQNLYPFADEGNDSGPLVFDGREAMPNNEFPIRVYDQDYGGELEGLSEIIFSSFSKLLECVTHFCAELKSRPNFEIIPEFFQIDPKGAGKTGVDYWLGWASMQKANFDEFGY